MIPRTEKLRKLNDTFDLLVIGGGATGSGIALDAALRGLKVLLVEGRDFASGTSSRSTKLLHGGVRYLESALRGGDYKQFPLVFQALKERHTILQIAPHLTNILPIVIPVYSWMKAGYYLTGLKTYELLAGRKSIGKSSFLSRKEVIESFPYLNAEGLKGGIQFFDGQFDDARLNLSIILKAEECGAVALNYMEVLGLEKENQESFCTKVKDQLTGKIFSVRSKVVVNAAGTLSDHVRRLAQTEAASKIVGSSGTHIILDGKFVQGRGLLIPKTSDGRVIFALPWMGMTLVGTTDNRVEITRDPSPSGEEIDYLIDHLNHEFEVVVERDEIKACWSGIRPLSSESGGDTSRMLRGFTILQDFPGFYSILGGKWTSYRKMAEVIVDQICRDEKVQGCQKCMTESTPVFGAEGFSPGLPSKLREVYDLDEDIALHLAHSYGGKAEEVILLSQKTVDGTKRLVEKFPMINGEIIYGIRNEMACTVLDVLCRRTRLAELDQRAAIGAIPKVMMIMAKEFGWNKGRMQEELDNARIGIGAIVGCRS